MRNWIAWFFCFGWFNFKHLYFYQSHFDMECFLLKGGFANSWVYSRTHIFIFSVLLNSHFHGNFGACFYLPYLKSTLVAYNRCFSYRGWLSFYSVVIQSFPLFLVFLYFILSILKDYFDFHCLFSTIWILRQTFGIFIADSSIFAQIKASE